MVFLPAISLGTRSSQPWILALVDLNCYWNEGARREGFGIYLRQSLKQFFKDNSIASKRDSGPTRKDAKRLQIGANMAAEKFWHLSDAKSPRSPAEWVHEEMDLESVPCSVDEGHQHQGKRLTDLSVKLPGYSPEDFVWTWYSECLMQDHVLHVLEKHGFTGFHVKPVKARFEKNLLNSPPRLWELVVTGWCGLAPPESGVRLEQNCNACGHMRYSGFSDPEKVIDESQWDGSDFFIVWPLPMYIFITDRVASVIKQAQFKGVSLVALSDLKPTDGHSPGRLSYVMPEARAREIGRPLGIF